VSDKETPGHHHDSPSIHREFDDQGECELSPPTTPLTVGAPIDTYLNAAQQQEDLPDANCSHRSRGRRKAAEKADLITKGLISQADADSLVQRYLSHLDRFLYGIASHYKDTNQIRRASPTLLAAICATTAFQDVNQRELFEICNREYRSLVSASMFENRSVDYVLALCIGSFWLPDASRILSSEAIRRAADARLHSSFHKLNHATTSSNSMPEIMSGFPDARDKVRLWYLLYICDQHLSILHNRDPMIRPEMEAIDKRDLFISDQTPPSSQDARLMSQVSLLVIMGQMRDLFGSAQTQPVPKALGVQFAHFARELDQWYSRYSNLLGMSAKAFQ